MQTMETLQIKFKNVINKKYNFSEDEIIALYHASLTSNNYVQGNKIVRQFVEVKKYVCRQLCGMPN